MSRYLFVLITTLGAIALAAPSPVQCEIAIVGGGPAGMYTAYRLAPTYGKNVCVFEKEKAVGGRMTDETKDAHPTEQSVWIGTGARRVNSEQKYVLQLGRELGIAFQLPEIRSQLINTRGHYGYHADEFIKYFPGLKGPFDQDPQTTREDEIYNLLLKERATAVHYPSLRAYITHLAGETAIPYLRGMSRFHADFDYEIAPSNHLDYLYEEFKTSDVNYFPVGGMGTFVKKMEAAALKSGVRIYNAEPLLSFEERTDGPGYLLHTPGHEVTATRLVIAAPPAGFDKVTGTLAEAIRENAEYRALLPIRIAVINQWWDKAWWNEVRNPAAEGDRAITWRAWSTDTCVTHTEIPQEEYLKDSKATRSVYTDDPECVQFFEDTFAKGGLPAVENEVVKGIGQLFNHHLTETSVVIPKPLKTTMHIWPGGWYFVRAGSKVSNAEIRRWSIEPLPGRKDLMMVGEAYWVDRPGWSEGAYYSVDALLKARFGILPRP